MAPSAKVFRCDDALLNPLVKKHIASLYMCVDTPDLEGWANHFTEDAIFKKGATNVQGRDKLLPLIQKSWAPIESRDHVVYAVFPLNGPAKTDEVMLNGQSYNTYKTGEKSTFTWAARMHFTYSDDGSSVLIDRYTIIVDTEPATIA
ncbi:fungal specific transcription factor [Ophiostoma piceae UAMH 11346]|uniref:Fungal specific transcription factor n=1 Tax=Ophiostoma piceae (strain UAMH 11346) TaxID=1262450 RepID=S3C734_OPHP1|nr:fungal specific transcription factor [Ophiostoma piceae UAMH 11346]